MDTLWFLSSCWPNRKSLIRIFFGIENERKLIIMVNMINNFVQCQWCNWYFSAEPDLEFEGFLKRQHTRLKYFQGSLMSSNDLERSKVKRSAKGWCYWKYYKNAFVDSYQKKSYNFTSLQWVFESSHYMGIFQTWPPFLNWCCNW